MLRKRQVLRNRRTRGKQGFSDVVMFLLVVLILLSIFNVGIYLISTDAFGQKPAKEQASYGEVGIRIVTPQTEFDNLGVESDD